MRLNVNILCLFQGYYECLRTESYNRGIRVTVLCPGPVFSRITENALQGKAGARVGESGRHQPNAKRMATSRCAHLCLIAIINQLDQAWITIQPVLFMHYWSQYAPSIFRWFFGVYMTPERARKIREGTDWLTTSYECSNDISKGFPFSKWFAGL